jgi:hypothetical protein
MSERGRLVDRVGVLRPLRLRDFRLLWLGMAVSLIGDGIYLISIAWLVYQDLDASPVAFAAVGIAWSLPQVLLLLATGALADRMDRRHLMIAGDLIRLVSIGTVGLLALNGSITVPILVALVAIFGMGNAVFIPAFNSIVPTIVPEDLLVSANSVDQVVRPIGWFVLGPTIGGILVTFGAGWAFLADALTFGVSALCISLMRVRPTPDAAGDADDLKADVVEGLRYVRSQRWILLSLLAAVVSLLCVWGPWETLVPFVVTDEQQLGGSGFDLALVFGAGGVASLLVGLIMAQRGTLPRRPLTVMYLAWSLGMLMTTGFGLVTALWQAMAISFVAEGSIALLVVVWYTLLQRLVPSDLLGRVVSLDWMITIAGLPLSFLIVGPSAGMFGADAVLIVAGILGAAATLTFMFVPGARGPERDGRLDEVRLDAPAEAAAESP